MREIRDFCVTLFFEKNVSDQYQKLIHANTERGFSLFSEKPKLSIELRFLLFFLCFFFYFICNIHLLSSSSVFLNVTVCLVIMTGININVQLLQWELYLMLLASGSSSQSSKWRLIWCRKRNAKLVLLIIVHMRLRQFSANIHYVTVAKYGEYYLQEMSASTLSTENLRPQLSTFFLYFFKSCEV